MAALSPQCTTSPSTADIHEQNVTFVICALESMPSKMSMLKELLIKTLFSLASNPTDRTFSIICCANQVLKWQNALVKCSLASVAEAAAWIRTLQLHHGASVRLTAAVAAALEDSRCQAVYLFTSGLAEWAAEELSALLKEAGQARPLHTVHLVQSGGEKENRSQELLEKIAKESGGSFQRIHFSSAETENQIHPGGLGSIQHPEGISKLCCCSSHPRGHPTTARSPLGVWSLDSPPLLPSHSAKEGFRDWRPKINDLQRGVRVLARKKTDGYFYRGHVVQHLEGSQGHVLIEFERSRKPTKAKAEFRMQETPLYDVIHHEDGRWQPVAAGDRVLAPWEKKGERYGPGTALQATETGSSPAAFKNREVLVNFWNGTTKKVPADVAVKIPLPLSERIVLELQMPLAARQMLVDQNPHYPYTVPPGYRASGSCWQNHSDGICCRVAAKVPQVSTTRCSPLVPPWPFHCPSWEHIRSPITSAPPENALIPGINMTKEELNRKVEEQLSRGRLPVLEDSENEESRTPEEEKNVVVLTSRKELESKVSISNKTPRKERASEEPREGPGTMVDVATNTDKGTPWQEQEVFPQANMNETSAQPFHQSPPRKLFIAPPSQSQATFVWVDQSLKEDSSAIESVLHMRRSHSAPAVQRLPPAAPSPEGAREAAKVEFRRQKWEQRRLEEEQKQEEERIQKEQLRDMKRHRSLQRSLQGSQKQQENRERAWQRLGRLQVAREERMKQESCLREEEKNKESQRLEFLKAQHRRRDQQLMEHKQRVDAQENKRLALLKNRIQSVQKNVKAAGQEEDPAEKKAAAKRQDFQKRDLVSQRAEKKRRETQDLQQYLKEQSLLMLRASLLS